MKKYCVSIEGMGCDNCVRSVRNALEELGATVESCVIGTAEILFDGSTDAIRNAIEDVGFDVKNIAEA